MYTSLWNKKKPSMSLWQNLEVLTMKVTNNAPYAIIAFGWHRTRGRGDDILIPPGSSAEVNGPFIGTDDGNPFVELSGTINCHEAPDDEHGFCVKQGKILTAGGFVRGVTIRHPLDEREGFKTVWRHPIAPHPADYQHECSSVVEH